MGYGRGKGARGEWDGEGGEGCVGGWVGSPRSSNKKSKIPKAGPGVPIEWECNAQALARSPAEKSVDVERRHSMPGSVEKT